MNLCHQFAFVVGLKESCLNVVPVRMLANHIFDVGQREAAVNLWFALAQQVQVRTVEEQYPHISADCYSLCPLLSN